MVCTLFVHTQLLAEKDLSRKERQQEERSKRVDEQYNEMETRRLERKRLAQANPNVQFHIDIDNEVVPSGGPQGQTDQLDS